MCQFGVDENKAQFTLQNLCLCVSLMRVKDFKHCQKTYRQTKLCQRDFFCNSQTDWCQMPNIGSYHNKITTANVITASD